jgi:hypothetical protein
MAPRAIRCRSSFAEPGFVSARSTSSNHGEATIDAGAMAGLICRRRRAMDRPVQQDLMAEMASAAFSGRWLAKRGRGNELPTSAQLLPYVAIVRSDTEEGGRDGG